MKGEVGQNLRVLSPKRDSRSAASLLVSFLSHTLFSRPVLRGRSRDDVLSGPHRAHTEPPSRARETTEARDVQPREARRGSPLGEPRLRGRLPGLGQLVRHHDHAQPVEPGREPRREPRAELEAYSGGVGPRARGRRNGGQRHRRGSGGRGDWVVGVPDVRHRRVAGRRVVRHQLGV